VNKRSGGQGVTLLAPLADKEHLKLCHLDIEMSEERCLIRAQLFALLANLKTEDHVKAEMATLIGKTQCQFESSGAAIHSAVIHIKP
jgi:hypothetical protein